MNSQLRQLVEKRAAAYAQGKDVLARGVAENRELTSEENTIVDKAFDDCEGYDSQISRLKREADLDTKFEEADAKAAEQRARFELDAGAPADADGEKPDHEARYADAWSNYVTRGYDAITGEERQMLAARDQELRAMGVITGTGGGFTAPASFWNKVTETMKWYGGMLQVGAEKVETPNGNPLTWPTNDDTANLGAWVGENQDHGTATDLTFGMKTLFAHGLTSRVLRVSRQYLQDTAPQTGEAFIARKIAERLGRTLNTALTVGDGVSKPQGILDGLTTGKTTGGATAITTAELIDLQHSVDPAYRMNGKFMFHDLVFAYLRKLVDANGLPIFAVSFRDSSSNTILGDTYVINNDMASTVATTNKTAVYGDFNAAYVWREVTGGGTLQRLDERYAEFQQVGFISFARYDGLVQDASAAKLLVQA